MAERITITGLLAKVPPNSLEGTPFQNLPQRLDFDTSSRLPLGERLMQLSRGDLKTLGRLTGMKDIGEIDFRSSDGDAGLGFPYPYARDKITPKDPWYPFLKNFNGHLKAHLVNIDPQKVMDRNWRLIIIEGTTDVFARRYVEEEGEEVLKEFDILFGWVSNHELTQLEGHSKKAWALDTKIYEGTSV